MKAIRTPRRKSLVAAGAALVLGSVAVGGTALAAGLTSGETKPSTDSRYVTVDHEGNITHSDTEPDGMKDGVPATPSK
ncbi:hypothetical protein ABZW32_19085 [Streptomyces sp. NPDC004667]|uniref:hypothetical protein n=1 Tax=Streptomyces sp. NPDC004667 TaxID=3154285 RepID=UPI0033A3A3F9